MVEFLVNEAADADCTFVFAHGAGAAMDIPFMNHIADGLALSGIRVVRFEFEYMAARRSGGPRRPPPRIEKIEAEFRSAFDELGQDGPVFLGGKSMGGRVASLIGGDLFAAGRIGGVVCVGYPFHPQNKPEKLRTDHLQDAKAPLLICQGSRDPFGTMNEVAGYGLSETVDVFWLEDGDHDLKPRKRVTGLSQQDHLSAVCKTAAGWMKSRI
ncbi:hypothetical protein BXY66_3745 [Shimia isoporae]|uniref:KANL3/Tex30 alpha/beta hydrolase-like domain-containing protein n=1 Tax=Shimia isoporae TaxID=647720 RepID=A0A4R1N0L0_9RHOB|nr:alpha/beta family hydrolase [Shimia isoporae]TCK99244.1 hypothetical protein BXY66_3745 [Shimia isoporae]